MGCGDRMINWMGISKMDLEKTYVVIINDNGNDTELRCCIMSNSVIMTPSLGESYTISIVQLASVLKYVKGIVAT